MFDSETNPVNPESNREEVAFGRDDTPSGSGGQGFEQTLIAQAFEQIAKKKYEPAARTLEDVLKKFGISLSREQKSIIGTELARVYVMLSMYDRAKFHAETALAARKDNDQALIILGKVAIAEYKFPVARGYFTQVSDGNPEKYLGLCLISIRLRDTSGAMTFIRMAQEKGMPGSHPEFRVMAAYCRLLSGNAATAVTEMREVLKDADHDMLLILLIAEVFMTAGNYGEAEAAAKKVQLFCPQNDQAMAILAHAEYADEDYVLAEDYARKAVLANPRNAYAKTILMKLSTRLGNYSQAEAIGKEILDMAPEYSLAHANLGDVYFNEGRYGLAELEYEQTMGLMSADTKGARLRKARMKFIKEDYEGAAEILVKLAMGEHVYYDDAMCDLALCYDRLGDAEKKEEVTDKMEMRRSFYHRTEKLLKQFQIA